MKLKMTFKQILLAAMSIVFFCSTSIAQETDVDVEDDGKAGEGRFKRLSITLNPGILQPYTDITQYDYYKVFNYKNENRPGIALSVGYSINNIFSLRAQGLYGRLVGTLRPMSDSEADYDVPVSRLTGQGLPARGVYFTTIGGMMEGNLSLLVNVRNLAFSGTVKDRKLNYFIYVGHGLVRFESQVFRLSDASPDDGTPIPGSTYKRGRSGVPGEKSTEAVNPVGVIFRYKMHDMVDLGMDISMRRVNSDKLDGFVAGESEDYYSFIALDLTFKPSFGANKDAESIDWVNPMETMYKDLQMLKDQISGLTDDKDSDGVPDMFDKDSNTEEGAVVSGSGVALDMDKDGVADYKDEDPFTPIGAKVDEKGKAVDSDGDGVPDALDLEPNTEKGSLVNFQGVSIAKKGEDDGVAGQAVYFPPIFFDFDKANIKYANYDRLAVIARALKNNPGLKIAMVGYADKVGPEKYNMELARRRAQAVVDHLAKYYNVSADRMSVESKGENEPLAEGINLVNRRVDVKVK